MPDYRFRIITNPDTDGIEGVHFGTLEGVIKKATKLRGPYINETNNHMSQPQEDNLTPDGGEPNEVIDIRFKE